MEYLDTRRKAKFWLTVLGTLLTGLIGGAAGASTGFAVVVQEYTPLLAAIAAACAAAYNYLDEGSANARREKEAQDKEEGNG